MKAASVSMAPGVLSNGQMKRLIDIGAISSGNFAIPEVGASAFDLRLGTKAWRLREGQRPTTRELAKLRANADPIAPQKDKFGDFFQFDAKNIYLVELDQLLKLPANISGRATGKSSIGRLDIITRLIANDSREYDVVLAGYDGPLHLLVLPQTFSIRVAPGASLNQLRLFCGIQQDAIIRSEQVPHYGTPFWYMYKDGVPLPHEPWVMDAGERMVLDPSMFDLTVDLSDLEESFIFKARTGIAEPLDLRKAHLAQYGKYTAADYFDKVLVKQDVPDRYVVLDTHGFYIMKSKERLFIPENVAVEVVAISERIGDIRIHYAGFAHPGFGRIRKDSKKGTPLIFEVRATDMPTKLTDSAILARVQLFRMSEQTDPDDSPYGGQELKLSGIFSD